VETVFNVTFESDSAGKPVCIAESVVIYRWGVREEMYGTSKRRSQKWAHSGFASVCVPGKESRCWFAMASALAWKPSIRWWKACATTSFPGESAWGAVPGLLSVRFPRPFADPGVRVGTHRALHGRCR
jgi:hypothetical protein